MLLLDERGHVIAERTLTPTSGVEPLAPGGEVQFDTPLSLLDAAGATSTIRAVATFTPVADE